MKYISFILLMLLLSNCKNDTRQNEIPETNSPERNEPVASDSFLRSDRDLQPLDKSISIEIKQKAFIEKKDEREQFQSLIIDKNEVIDTKDFTINFTYPLLNETLNPRNRTFNNFINDYYANVTKTISEINESKSLCDSIEAKTFREERFIDYKIYIVNDQLVSVLFYKENFYSGAMHPSYSFDCFNFNQTKGVFMKFEDFFVEGSEDELLAMINTKINKEIKKGAMYYDCWEVATPDFFESKNNFVVNDTFLEYYFDDCVMCPSYTGTYSIQLPLMEVMSLLKKSNSNPLVL